MIAEPNSTRTADYRWLLVPLAIFIITRSAIFIVGYSGRLLFLDEIGKGPWHSHYANTGLDIWDRWDSIYYRGIARDGYSYDSSDTYSVVVFFPVYPLLMRAATAVFRDLTWAGVVVSHLCLLGALMFLYRLALFETDDEPTARRAILYISIFPTAFFFGAVYSESAFLLFAAGAVYFARRRLWLPAALLGMAASATRVIGLALYVFLLVEWWQVNAHVVRVWFSRDVRPAVGETRRALGALLLVQLSALGLFLYMAYLQLRFGNPLLFLDAQAAWKKGVGASPWHVLNDLAVGIRQMTQTIPIAARWVLPDVISGLSALIVVPFIWRRFGFNYALFTILCVLVPILSGNTQSLFRYVLVVFPMFFMLAHWGRNDYVDKAIVVTSCVLLGLFFTVFANWGWVA